MSVISVQSTRTAPLNQQPPEPPRNAARPSAPADSFLNSQADQIANLPLATPAPIADGQEAAQLAAAISQQIESLARKEIDSRVARYQQHYLDTFASEGLSEEERAKLKFVLLDWDQPALIYLDAAGQRQTRPLDSERDLALFQDFLRATLATGPVEQLSDDTLAALLRMPGEPGQPGILEAHFRLRRLQAVSDRVLREANPGPGNWAMALDSEDPENDMIKLVNSENPAQSLRIRVSDDIRTEFVAFQRYLSQQLAVVARNLKYEAGNFTARPGRAASDVVDGLQGLFALRLIKAIMSPDPQSAGTGTQADLLKSMKQMATKAQIIVGGTDFSLDVAEMLTALTRPADTNTALTQLRGIAGKTMLMLSALNLGLSIGAIVMAKPEDRAAMIPRLVLDSTAFTMSMTGAVAGGTAGAVTSALAVPVVGLSFGVSALVTHFSALIQQAVEFGQALHTLHQNIVEGGLDYDAQKGTLSARSKVTITELNLKEKSVAMATPLIQGARIHTLHTPDIGQVAPIDIGQRLHWQLKQFMPAGALSAQTIHLPGNPKTLIGYQHLAMPFITWKNEPGFDLLRSLEGDDFLFDGYFWPGDRGIGNVHHVAQPTTVKIVLDGLPRRLQMPKLPTESYATLTYNIKADAGHTVIGLMPEARLRLESSAARLTSWTLDARDLPYDDVYMYSNGIAVGGVMIELSTEQFDSQVTVIGKNGLSTTLDLKAAYARMTQMQITQGYEIELTQAADADDDLPVAAP